MTAKTSGTNGKGLSAGELTTRSQAFLQYLQDLSSRGERATEEQLASLGMARTPYTVLYEEGSCRVLSYEVLGERNDAPPILMVYSFINRWYILDLQPGHSFIETLSRAGHKVYLIDWGIPGPENDDLDLDYYLEKVALRAVKRIRRAEGGRRLTLFGYCIGGTLTAMMAALHPEHYAGLVLLTAPLDFEDAGILSLWTNPKFFDPEKITSAFGSVPEKILHASFPYMKPKEHLARNRLLFENILDEKYVRNFRSIERWSTDNVPFPGRVYHDFVKGCYQKNQLAKGEFRVGDRTVDLGRVSCPVLNIYAKNDHIVPCATAERSAQLLAGTKTWNHPYEASHITVTVAHPIRETVWKDTLDWLRTNTTRRSN
ncbi:MAG: alpha/beta fold hydrolase [Candidatus Wallbacteria bacterium]|nr:alpha/beta fold hydrolase [Candidatus Wallbacteria bacterium]